MTSLTGDPHHIDICNIYIFLIFIISVIIIFIVIITRMAVSLVIVGNFILIWHVIKPYTPKHYIYAVFFSSPYFLQNYCHWYYYRHTIGLERFVSNEQTFHGLSSKIPQHFIVHYLLSIRPDRSSSNIVKKKSLWLIMRLSGGIEIFSTIEIMGKSIQRNVRRGDGKRWLARSDG